MLTTDRLLLRRWRPDDRAPFAAMNADPAVRRFFSGLLTRAQSDASAARFDAAIERDGFGLFALELPGEAGFIGFTGLMRVTFEAPFTPAVEIGWRLAPAYQGRGLATEAARACLDFGFNNLGLSEIVAFTVPDNTASRRVMDKLGMAYDERDNFEHPNVPSHDPLRHHLLYRRQAPAS
jgi:RimJ/RimL family protein N-acetyltransferase